GARGHRLPAPAPRHSAADRDFVLYISLALVHARYLPWRAPAHTIAARFCTRSFVFSAACRRPNCPRRRFSSATRASAKVEDGTVSLGFIPDDSRSVRESGAGRYTTLRHGRSCVWLSWPIGRGRFVDGGPGICRTDLFRF